MYSESSLKKHCQRILEENGGYIADKASRILLEDPKLKDLRSPLEFISKNWRNPLTPSMISLSCEAVGGRSDVTYEAALAMNLMSLSFYIWDDMLDKAVHKSFKPTLFGKFGEGTALVIGGLASAKAFSILNQMDVDKTKRQKVTNLVWNLWTKMARAETINLKLRNQGNLSSKTKLWVIKTEATDLETCLRIGAILGNCSKNEVKHLARYGLYIGIILELWKDFLVSINLTLELADKIKNGALPYSLLLARERSDKVRKKLEDLANRNEIKSHDTKEIIEYILEAKAMNSIIKKISKTAKIAEEELIELKKSKATKTLKFFVKAQPQLFIESLSMFQR